MSARSAAVGRLELALARAGVGGSLVDQLDRYVAPGLVVFALLVLVVAWVREGRGRRGGGS